MFNLTCLIGTRPEAIKMAPVMRALAAHENVLVRLVSTGQHREMIAQFSRTLGLEIAHDLDVMQPDQSLAGLSARVLRAFDPILRDEPADMLLVQGDTTSVMIGALVAFYRDVPVGHVEAGLRTPDIRHPFPEEMNRRMASLLARLHFAPTERTRDNLLAEGIDPSRIFVTGNTVIDMVAEVAGRGAAPATPLDPGRRTILITAHRRDNHGQPIREICAAIRDLHDARDDVAFVYPVHPNPNVKGPVRELLGSLDRVRLVDPVPYEELVALMKASTLILTDSGGIQEEAPFLAKPVLVMREETERPEAVDAGVALLVGADRQRIVAETNRLLDDPEHHAAMGSGASPFGDGRAGARIAEHCLNFLQEAYR